MGPETILMMFNKLLEDAKWAERARKREEEERDLEEQAEHWRKQVAEVQAVEATSPRRATSEENVKKFSADTEARWNCKDKKKYWFGSKRRALWE